MMKRPGGALTLIGGDHRGDGARTGNTSSANHQLYHVGSPGVGDEIGIHRCGI